MNNSQSTISNKIIVQNGLSYLLNIQEKTASIIGCKSTYEEIIISRSIKYKSTEYSITSIAKEAFQDSIIESITFSSDSALRTIEEEAFYNSKIERFTIPSSLIDLQDGWCRGINKLTTLKISSNNPRYKLYDNNRMIIGKSSIENDNYDELIFCIKNVKTVTIPKFIRRITPCSFERCRCLQQVDVPTDSQLQTICKYAFRDTAIEKFIVPHSLKKICEYAFFFCQELQSIEIPFDCELQTVGRSAFRISKFNHFTISDNLFELQEDSLRRDLNSFSVSTNNPYFKVYDDCKMIIKKSSMKSKTFDVLFFADRNLTSITIPSFIKEIGPCSLYSCKMIEKVEIPIDSELQIIRTFALTDLLIEKFIIPCHLKKIEKYAFSGCKNLKTIEFQENSELQTIEEAAFSSSIIESLTIPSSVIDLQDRCFDEMEKLSKISISPNNPKYKLINDDQILIGKSLINNECYDILLFCINKMIKSVKIPNTIKYISKSAFRKCSSLQIVDIPNDSELRMIGDYAFSETSIESFFISPHITQIGQHAFDGCKKLKKVEITEDSELCIIEYRAFYSTSIESFYIPPHLTKICEEAFNNVNTLQKVTVSSDSELQVIENRAFYSTQIKSFSIPPHLIRICDSAFGFCKKLQNVIIPINSELQVIGNSAFMCTSIQDFTVPLYLQKIGKKAFDSCKKLYEVKIPNNCELQMLDEGAFQYTSIEYFTYPPTLIEVDEKWCMSSHYLINVFVHPNNPRFSHFDDDIIVSKSSIEQINYDILFFCNKNVKKEVKVPSCIKRIAANSFEYCEKLTKIELNPQLLQIGECAFSYCRKLKKVFVPENSELQKIEKEAFQYSQIESFIIPSHIRKIGESVFFKCQNLQIIEIQYSPSLRFNLNVFDYSEQVIIMTPIHFTVSYE